MRTKRILIFSLAYQPFMGGAEIAIQQITERLKNRFQFDIVTLHLDAATPRYERVGATAVYRVGFSKKHPTPKELVSFPLYLNKIFFPIFAFIKALALHRKNHYDAVWVMMAYAGFPMVFFNFFYSRMPYVLTLQEGDTVEHITQRRHIRLAFPFLRSVFKNASAVTAISHYLGDYAKFMGYRGEVAILPNGADMENFSSQGGSAFGGKFPISPPEEDRPSADPPEEVRPSAENFQLNELKEKLKIKPHDKIILTTSRLVEKNAVDDIIKSLTFLSKDVTLLVAGDGPDREKLEALVREKSLETRVKFLGHVSYEKLPVYYALASVFVRPSLSEGMGSSFIEAMAAGIPIVGTLVGGITDFLKDNETGFVCEVRNPKSVADRIGFILNSKNQSVVSSVVKHAREFVEKRYDWNYIAKHMAEVFDTVA